MIFYFIGILSYYKAIKKPVPFGICLPFFLVVIIPPVTTFYFLLHRHWIFQVIAFAIGVLCWTFIEYCVCRFWFVRKENKNRNRYSLFYKNHRNIIMSLVKIIGVTIMAFLATIYSIFYNSYLYLPAGILTGYALFIFIRVWEYTTWPKSWNHRHQKIFLQQSIKIGKTYYGKTVRFWDKLFNTYSLSDKNKMTAPTSFFPEKRGQQKFVVLFQSKRR